MKLKTSGNIKNIATNETSPAVEQKKPGQPVLFTCECRSGGGKTISKLMPLIEEALRNREGAYCDVKEQPYQPED